MSDTTPTGPMQLTADDCAAIRGATTYVVRLEGEAATLELSRRDVATRRGFGRTNVELERTIGGAAGSLTRATFVQLYPGGAWQALARIVRPGDVLRFFASEDNSNSYSRAAVIPAHTLEEHATGYDRLYVDELCVHVVRKGRLVLDRLVLCYSICPQNSARAVKPDGRGKRYPSEVA